jgi:hypothetical protein
MAILFIPSMGSFILQRHAGHATSAVEGSLSVAAKQKRRWRLNGIVGVHVVEEGIIVPENAFAVRAKPSLQVKMVSVMVQHLLPGCCLEITTGKDAVLFE